VESPGGEVTYTGEVRPDATRMSEGVGESGTLSPLQAPSAASAKSAAAHARRAACSRLLRAQGVHATPALTCAVTDGDVPGVMESCHEPLNVGMNGAVLPVVPCPSYTVK